MRVGFVIDSLSAKAGTESQLLLLLSAFDRERVKPLLVTFKNGPASFGPSVPCTHRPANRVLSASGVLALLRAARDFRQASLDLVVTFFLDGNLLGTIAARLARVPVVSSRRSLARDYWQTPERMRQLRLLNRVTCRHLVNSEAARRFTAEVEHVPLDRITVIRNAIDTDRFHPPDHDERCLARDRLRIPPESTAVACVANLRPVKDHRTLLRSVAALRDRHPDLVLLLAGQGEEEDALRALAAEIGISHSVRFLGSMEDTVPLLHACDALALASVSESLPNAVMEGLACGLPVAATNVGGVPELLEGRPFGRMAPPSNPEALATAIDEVFAGPVRDPAIRLAARNYAVENFSLPVILDQWYAFFDLCRKETGRTRSVQGPPS